MSEHSPGPWQSDEAGDTVFSPTGPVCDLYGGMGYRERKANARLIAAAPELLEALKKLLGQVHGDCLREGEEAAVDSAGALITRIEG